jgi:hypothetical protein
MSQPHQRKTMYPTSSIPQCLSRQTIRRMSPFTQFNLTVYLAWLVYSHHMVVVKTQTMISHVSGTKQGQKTPRIFSEIQK